MKCKCNGSSGTDCFWCGGSGYSNYKNNRPINSEVQVSLSAGFSKNTSTQPAKSFKQWINELHEDFRNLNKNTRQESIIYISKKIAQLQHLLQSTAQLPAYRVHAAKCLQELALLKKDFDNKIFRLRH